MYKYASKYNVKYILTGANLSTECVRNPIEWMYYQSDSTQLKDIHKKFGQRKLKTFPLSSILWHKLWLPYFRKIKVLKPLDYIDFDKKNAIKILKNDFGWQPYKQKHFESRFTKFYESYWLPERFGFDVRKVQFSSLILTGQMDRDEALQLLKKPAYEKEKIKNELKFVANKLEISLDELEAYFKLPQRTYKDYKNQSYIYNLGSKIMKTLNLEIGGKR